jgi:hypothetical protein
MQSQVMSNVFKSNLPEGAVNPVTEMKKYFESLTDEEVMAQFSDAPGSTVKEKRAYVIAMFSDSSKACMSLPFPLLFFLSFASLFLSLFCFSFSFSLIRMLLVLL